ncbi:uncharacterized protein LOC130721163 [Lotus japonicus]|uniref:uncharacterized protein LOC130721163 n=1 Tax=Lotus japonicus TaxID=34305 RepID=UPI00258DC59C|nr:uncharacterized protein LOC130721163 [Lotus japonicus]XP_057427890.1 uncharacterized protein LOC130721163 [Lotus japonicus]
MKTIYGECLSFKEISLSKATKVISQFASADNGASEVVSAYLHRASASFVELNNLHKELKSKKRLKRQTETGEDSGRVIGFGTQSFGSQNDGGDDEKSTQTKVNGTIGYEKVNMNGGEKQKKNKLSKQEKESSIHGDSILKSGEGEIDGKLTAMSPNEGYKKKKLKEGENAKGQEQRKEIDKKLSNNIEGENGSVGHQDLQNKKKKKYETESEDKLYAEDVKIEGKKKRKNEDLEWRQEDRSGELTQKRKKTKL